MEAARVSNYIGGVWLESQAATYLPVLNPATGETLGQVPLSTASEVNSAVQAAARAFPEWRQTPPTERVQYLFKLKRLLEEHLDGLARTLTNECGKTFQESLEELRRGIQTVTGEIQGELALYWWRRVHGLPSSSRSTLDL